MRHYFNYIVQKVQMWICHQPCKENQNINRTNRRKRRKTHQSKPAWPLPKRSPDAPLFCKKETSPVAPGWVTPTLQSPPAVLRRRDHQVLDQREWGRCDLWFGLLSCTIFFNTLSYNDTICVCRAWGKHVYFDMMFLFYQKNHGFFGRLAPWVSFKAFPQKERDASEMFEKNRAPRIIQKPVPSQKYNYIMFYSHILLPVLATTLTLTAP